MKNNQVYHSKYEFNPFTGKQMDIPNQDVVEFGLKQIGKKPRTKKTKKRKS